MLQSYDYSDERRFSDKRRDDLVKQINNWLGDLIRNKQLPYDQNEVPLDDSAPMALSARGSWELGEHFLMACLKQPEVLAVTSLDKDLSGLIEPTGRRHHQLKFNKIPLAYARSLVEDDDSLCQLFATRLAGKVENAITWLDTPQNQPPEFTEGTWFVQLVTIPTYHAHAFLINKTQNGNGAAVGDSFVFVISAPPWLESLQEKRLFDTREFLLAFKDKKPIIGLQTGKQKR
jgi:hypothetical protein